MRNFGGTLEVETSLEIPVHDQSSPKVVCAAFDPEYLTSTPPESLDFGLVGFEPSVVQIPEGTPVSETRKIHRNIHYITAEAASSTKINAASKDYTVHCVLLNDDSKMVKDTIVSSRNSSHAEVMQTQDITFTHVGTTVGTITLNVSFGTAERALCIALPSGYRAPLMNEVRQNGVVFSRMPFSRGRARGVQSRVRRPTSAATGRDLRRFLRRGRWLFGCAVQLATNR
jgi:hypothetical protein